MTFSMSIALILGALAAVAAASPTQDRVVKRGSVDRFDIYFSPDIVRVGMSSPWGAYHRAYDRCFETSCEPGASVAYPVIIHESGGAYQQKDEGTLTVTMNGTWNNEYGYDWKERNARKPPQHAYARIVALSYRRAITS
jgi:hypothetical protein